MMRLSKFMVLCVLMVSISAHPVLLQPVAWLGMAISYSAKSGSVAVGLSQTFDGEHPCLLCSAIKKTQDHQQDPGSNDSGSSPIAKLKLDKIKAETATLAARSDNGENAEWPGLEQDLILRFIRPPVPPPRAAAA